MTVLFGASALTFAAILIISVLRYSRSSERFLLGHGAARTDVAAFAGASIVGAVVACAWWSSTNVAVLVLTFGTPLFPPDASILDLLWIFGALLIWLLATFFLLAWERYQEAFVLGVSVFLIGIFLCAPRLGGITLRALGYGGGLPISVIARLAEPGSLTAPPERVNGCLLLATGSQVSILHPVDKRVSLSQCHFRPLTPNFVNGHRVPTRLDTLPRDDVLDIIFVGKRS